MFITVEGVYRNGSIELVEVPDDLNENTPVIVTFLPRQEVDLQARQISRTAAAELRARLLSFADEWDSPEMDMYDHYDQFKASIQAR